MMADTATDARCFLLHGNRLAEAALSGGDWALPLDNLAIANLYQDVARCVTGDPADAVIQATWSRPMTVGGLALVGYTGPASSKIRITWTKDGVTSGPPPAWTPIVPRVARTIDLSYDDASWWTGRPSAKLLATYTPIRFEVPAIRTRADALMIEIDSRGEPFDLSYLYVSPLFRPAWPMDWGRKMAPTSRRRVATTLGGMLVAGPAAKAPRRQTVTFQELTKTEAMRLLDIGLTHDVVEPVIYVPDPTDSRNHWREVYMARFVELVSWEEVSPDRYRATVIIEEIIA